MKYSLLIIANLFLLSAFSSCTGEDSTPIPTGTQVTVNNTLQVAADTSMGGTGGVEMPVEAVLKVPVNTFVLSATVGSGIEYDDFLGGLYDIDISETEIKYTLVAAPNDPLFGAFFRTLEPGTYDRYYLKFAEEHGIKSGVSSDSAVSFSVRSSKEVLVEIGEGYNFNSGTTFTITLE